MNKTQIYLLNANIDDVVVSGGDDPDPENWKYLSDVMGEYHLSASQPVVEADAQKECRFCGLNTGDNFCSNCGRDLRTA